MKTKIIISLIALLTFSFIKKESKEVIIKTSSECNMCKERLEEKLNYTKGIQYVNLDVPTKMLTVKYKEEKITLEKIKTIISETGYDADDVKANPEAQQKLPKCCQPHGMSH
ncbi:MAG: heavy-metal-associated domain-containing protein [Flavobacteriia bacterium]|nr:heavy-metal-associated domain-containing protein [Flavobacteriia bacterium]